MPWAISQVVGTERFLSIASALSRHFDADIFLSGSSISGESTCYVAIEPSDEMVVEDSTGKVDLARFAFADTRPTFGFLSYNYGMKLKGLESDRSSFPLGHLKKYTAVVTYDTRSGVISVNTGENQLRDRITDIVSSSNVLLAARVNSFGEGWEITQSLSRDEYIDRVRKILAYIRSGDVYQLSLSIKYSIAVDALPVADLALALFSQKPAEFYAYFKSGHRQILSTSPECFLQVRDGRVLSRPIKGTLRFDTYDANLETALKSSPKEDAELSMIVDLIRNDISMNCEYDSVSVSNHKSVFAVDNLLQMYSNVNGRLREDRTCIDLLIDAFPGGSVTGCPKRRAMELIDELEPHSRDIYCGSFFIIKDEKTMDSSIAIRTGYFDEQSSTFNFFAGSGIVVESNPAAEHDETVAKAEKFLNLPGY